MQVVVKSEVNVGIMEAWRNAWSWKKQELFIVIEDDVEMSPQWYIYIDFGKLKIATTTLMMPSKSGTGP